MWLVRLVAFSVWAETVANYHEQEIDSEVFFHREISLYHFYVLVFFAQSTSFFMIFV